MGGSGQPYLYEAASRTSFAYPQNDFNPRAATQAHYQAEIDRAERSRMSRMQEGKPLINFNAHPDSYMPVSVQPNEVQELPPNTKRNVVWTRWFQLAMRVVQEIGALGILVCVICLKMQNDAPGYMIRIAPAWDVVVSLYAIYHLARPAKGRTPGSSLSYHLFALVMDTGLIPFYILSAMCAQQNWTPNPNQELRWTSFFSTEFATQMVIHVLFYGSIGMGAMHLFSVGVDLYLAVMFRKIMSMPPDMNPLEDNLTGSTRRSRLSSRHKYKNSEATFSSVSTDDLDEKFSKHLNDSAVSLKKGPEARVVPFGHSRMDSNDNFSPHNPNSARLSRQQYEEFRLYQGAQSARNSRQDLGASQKQADSPYHLHGMSDQHDTADSKSIVKSQQKSGLLNDTWYVHEGEVYSDLGMPRSRTPPVLTEPTLPDVDAQPHDSFQPQMMKPLNMNPPTPPLQEDFADEYRDSYRMPGQYADQVFTPIEPGVGRTLTVASRTTNTSSVYSESAPALSTNGRPANGTPKGKHYGDLASATRGVRGAMPPPRTNARTNRDRAPPGMTTYGVPTPASSRTPSPQKNGGRVISRSGVDIADGHYQPAGRGYGMRDRRDVSGKVAEEGRGHW